MRLGILLFTLCLTGRLIAQSHLPSTILLKGKVRNNTDTSLHYFLTGFLGDGSDYLKLKKDGSFEQLLPVDGMQNLSLIINEEAVTFYVQPADTMELSWDKKDMDKTLVVKGPDRDRLSVWQLNLKTDRQLNHRQQALHDTLYKIKVDAVKYRMINDALNKDLEFLADNAAQLQNDADKFFNEIYFTYAQFLSGQHLSNKFGLIVNPQSINAIPNLLKGPEGVNATHIVDIKTFYSCPAYRSFLYDYIRFNALTLNYNNYYSTNRVTEANGVPQAYVLPYTFTKFYSSRSESLPFTPVWDGYYAGLLHLKSIDVQEWYHTKIILDGFASHDFLESEAVLKTFLQQCQSAAYKDTLQRFYANIQKLRPGSSAPAFTLQDNKGKNISLNDFKGKVVYLDFWGVDCAPCIYDIERLIPKLHSRYKGKDVVFINICVDTDKKGWKKALEEYKLDGINLIAEGWTDNPVCKDYNVNGIPHYVLIDKEGKLVNSNADRPYQLLSGPPDPTIQIKNAIDKVLEKTD